MVSGSWWVVCFAGLLTVAACDAGDEESQGASGAGGQVAGAAAAGTGVGAGGTAATDGGAAAGGTPHAAGTSGDGGTHEGSAAAGAEANDAGASAAGSASGGAPETGGLGGQSAGGDASGGEAGQGEAAPAVAYVSSLLGELVVASLDPTSGAPTPLPSSPVDVAGSLHGVAVGADGKFLFVAAEPDRIDTYPIAADGSLPAEPSSSAPVDDDNLLLAIALDPLGRFAYGLSPFSKSIYAFSVEPSTGVLTPSAEPLLVGSAPDHRGPAFAAVDPTGRFVYVTQLPVGPSPDDGIRGYRVDPTSGELTELANSPFADGNVAAGALVFRPDGKFLFSSGGGVNAFAIDDDGNLGLVEGSPFSLDVQSDPWAPNIAIDPQGKLLYVTNFGPTRHVTGFAIDALSGALEPVPGTPITTAAPYSLALGPGGRVLYVGDDNGEISAFKVHRPSGRLSALENSPFPVGGAEAHFAFVTLPGALRATSGSR